MLTNTEHESFEYSEKNESKKSSSEIESKKSSSEIKGKKESPNIFNLNLLKSSLENIINQFSFMKVKEYNIIKNLGKGSFGETFLVEKMGISYVLKKIKHKQVYDNEIKILKRISKNAFFNCGNSKSSSLCLLDNFELENNYYIVTNYLQNGITLEKLLNKMIDNNLLFSIEDIQFIFTRLIIDLYSLHVSKIIHLDIKPDNIIIKLKSNFDLNMLNDITQEELNNLKIIEQVIYIDYGLSCYKICNAGGTLLYMAPEMLKLLGKDDNLSYEFSAKCDIYSLGIVFYYILNMELPINGDYTIYYLYKMLEKNKISSLSSLKYSEEIRTFIDNYDDLIDNMIIFNPKQRFSINKVYRFIKRNNLSIFTPSPSRQRTENSF